MASAAQARCPNKYRVVCSLPDRIVIEAQGADINPEQSWA